MKMKKSSVKGLAAYLQTVAEIILATMLAVAFVAFVIQVVFRYFLSLPTGWTTELTLISWLWLVLWGAAFVNKDAEEIRIDLLTSMVNRKTRIVMAILATGSIVALYAISLPATYSYISFMQIEKSAYLKIPMSWLYSIFLLFLIASLARFVWQLWFHFRGEAPEQTDPTKTVSGL